MLLLLNERKNNLRIFSEYGGLCNFIEAHEKDRHIKKDKRKAQSWIFARHSYRRLMTYQGLYSNPMVFPIRITANRNENSWDVLEIVSGNPEHPAFIPLAHNVDIEPLQQNWCKKYCAAHGYTLIEVANIQEFKKLASTSNHKFCPSELIDRI
jgi:hypothetical protein